MIYMVENFIKNLIWWSLWKNGSHICMYAGINGNQNL